MWFYYMIDGEWDEIGLSACVYLPLRISRCYLSFQMEESNPESTLVFLLPLPASFGMIIKCYQHRVYSACVSWCMPASIHHPFQAAWFSLKWCAADCHGCSCSKGSLVRTGRPKRERYATASLGIYVKKDYRRLNSTKTRTHGHVQIDSAVPNVHVQL